MYKQYPNTLEHGFKYIKRYKKNGKWRYIYASPKTHLNITTANNAAKRYERGNSHSNGYTSRASESTIRKLGDNDRADEIAAYRNRYERRYNSNKNIIDLEVNRGNAQDVTAAKEKDIAKGKRAIKRLLGKDVSGGGKF